MKIIKKLLSALLTGAIMLSTICAGTISAGATKVSPVGIAVSQTEDKLMYGVLLSEEQIKIWSDPASYTKTCKDGHAYGLRIDLLFMCGSDDYNVTFLRFKDGGHTAIFKNGVQMEDPGKREVSVYREGLIFSLPSDSPLAERFKLCGNICCSNVMMYTCNEEGCPKVSAEHKTDSFYYTPVSYIMNMNLISSPYNFNDFTADSVKVSKISDKAYTGKEITPAFTVKDGDKELVKGTDYIALYSSNKDIGSAVIIIAGQGKYAGKKYVNFDIVPKKTTLKAKKSGNTKAKLSWTGVEGAEKYQIYCSTDGKSYKRLATVSGDKTSYTASKLNFKKHDYKFKVRSYKTVNEIKYYSSYSKAKTLK